MTLSPRWVEHPACSKHVFFFFFNFCRSFERCKPPGICLSLLIAALNVADMQGDPLGDGTGGESIWGGEFEDEFHRNLRHDRPFTLSMANGGTFTLVLVVRARAARMGQVVEFSSDFSGRSWITVQYAETVVR